MPKGKVGKRGDAGKLKTNYPKPLRYKLDVDYWDKLDPHETEWLAHFLDAHYGGDFRGRGGTRWAPGRRRQVWSDKRAALEDAYGQAELYGAVAVLSEVGKAARDPRSPVDGEPGPTQQDLEPTPAYLNSEEYKRARDAFRATLAPGRSPKAPVETHRYRNTARRLAVVTPDPELSDSTKETEE